MNAFSMDYLSSNLNHIYSSIKENLSTTSNYLSALVKKNLSPILNDQQQRIALIVTGVFVSLVASYALYRCCRKRQIVPVKVVPDRDVSVTSVATVAVNPLGGTGEMALSNQANSGSVVSDTIAKIGNEPVEAASANDNVSDTEERKEEKCNSPIRRPKSLSGTISQASTQTTPGLTRSIENWKERECKGDSSVMRRGTLQMTHGNGTISSILVVDRIQEDHPKYGSFQGKLKDGVYEGTRTCKNGAIQTGKFKRSENGEYLLDDPNGKIVHIYTNNGRQTEDKMTGHFVEGQFNRGERIVITTEPLSEISTEVRMEGTFLKFALHGPDGMITHSNGNVYQGTFENNCLHDSAGYNYKIIQGHGIFEGAFVGNRLHGKGRRTFPNGDTFKGVFINDQLTDSKGKKILANGDIIEGHFVQDQLRGPGKKTLVNGDVLEGIFIKDQLNDPNGKKTSANGEILQGKFVNDQFITPTETKENTITPPPILFRSSSSQVNQAPVASKVQTELRTFGVSANTTSSHAKGPIKFPSSRDLNVQGQQ